LQFIIISAKVNVVNIGGDKEIGRSALPCFRRSVYMMTHNSNNVIAPTTAQTATPAITFPSFSPAAKRLFFLPPLSLL